MYLPFASRPSSCDADAGRLVSLAATDVQSHGGARGVGGHVDRVVAGLLGSRGSAGDDAAADAGVGVRLAVARLNCGTQTEGKRDRENERFSPSLHLSIPLSLRPFILAGIFLGLSAYTYLSSRALPILLVIFTLYLALFARKKMLGKWRGLFISFIIAGLIALPLAVALLTQPDLQFRVSEVSGPLDKALKGDSAELAANIPRTFGMFTGQGDTTVA